MRKSLVVSPRLGPKETGRSTRSGLEMARNMLDFSPVQQFQKQFSALDQAMTKLRHLNPPKEVNSIFDEFDTLKKKYSAFFESCQSVLRQYKLGNESKGVPEEHMKVISGFPSASNTFFTLLVGFNSRKPKIFYGEARNLGAVMEDAVVEFAQICLKEQQSRLVFKQYDNSLRFLVSELRTQMHDLFKQGSFEQISQEKVSEVIETAKRLSRVFETDLQHGLFLQKTMSAIGAQYVSKFHAGFVGLVPLLASIPPFNDLLGTIFASVETYSEILMRVMEDTKVQCDVDPIVIPIDTKGEVTTSSSIQNDLVKLDPVTHFLEELSRLLGISSEGNEDKVEWCEELLATARKTIHDLEYENHQLKTRVHSKDFITSETAITDRFVQNKKFQEDLQHEYAKEKDELLRSLVATVKTLVPGEILHHDDDYETQVQTLVTNCRINMDNTEKQLNEMDNMMKNTRNTLRLFYKSQFYQDISDEADLGQTAEILIRKLTKLHKKLDEKITAASAANNELNMFLRSVLNGRLEEVEGLTGAQLKKGLISCISNLEQELQDTKDKLSECIDNHNNFEQKAIECVSKVQSKLAMATSIEPDVTSSTFDDLASHVLGMFAQFEKEMDAQNTFRKFLCSFLSQLRFALGLPPIRLINLNREELQDVMVGILDSPPVQEGLGLAKHRPPNPEDVSRVSETSKQTNTVKETDPQFVFTVHDYLAERCGQLQGGSQTDFMHLNVDKLMGELTSLIDNKNKYVKALRSVIHDVAIRLGCQHNHKEAENVELDAISQDIFQNLEILVNRARENAGSTAIEAAVALIHAEDMKQFDSMNLKPIECIKAELQKVSRTSELLAPIFTLTSAIADDLDNDGPFLVPLTPEFDRQMDQIENLKLAAARLPVQQVHPGFGEFVTHAVELIAALATTISSVTFAEKFSQDQQKLTELLSNRQESETTIKKLTHQIADQVQEIQRIKTKFAAFVEACRTIVQSRSSQLTEIHKTEIEAILGFYSGKEP